MFNGKKKFLEMDDSSFPGDFHSDQLFTSLTNAAGFPGNKSQTGQGAKQKRGSSPNVLDKRL